MLRQLSTPGFSEDERKRQHGRLIAVLVVVAVIGFIVLMIGLQKGCGSGSDGSFLGLPCH